MRQIVVHSQQQPQQEAQPQTSVTESKDTVSDQDLSNETSNLPLPSLDLDVPEQEAMWLVM